MSSGNNRGFSVYVGPICAQTTEDDLKGHFLSCGLIQNIKICPSKNPSIKYAFVNYTNEESAIKASEKNGNLRIGKYQPRINYDPNKHKSGSGVGASNSFTSNSSPSSSWQPKDMNKAKGSFPGDLLSKPDIVPNNNHGGFKQERAAKPTAREQMVMSHVETPTCFWAQNAAKAEELNDLSEMLNTVCSSAPRLSTDQPSMSKIYACKYSVDESWYRCQACQYNSINESLITFIDFGNKEAVANDTIVELPASLSSVAPIARKLCLHGLKPLHTDSETQGFIQGRAKLQELLDGHVLNVSVMGNFKHSKEDLVTVEADGVDVNQEILDANFAAQRYADNRQNQWSGKSSSSSDKGHNGAASPSPAITQTSSASYGSYPISDESVTLTALRNELERVKKERDTLTIECASYKGSLQNLKQEKMQIQQQLKNSSLSSKVTNVLGNVNKVRSLRAQFPSDGEKADGIEHALSVVQESKALVLETGQEVAAKVNEKLAMFQRSQDAIRGCTDQTSLPDLIACRDQCRQMLCDSIELLLSTTQDLPLKQNGATLSQILFELTNVYGSFLDKPCEDLSLGEAVPLYEAWRAQKKSEFQEVRTKTNTSHNSLFSALDSLQKMLCIDDAASEQSLNTMGNLDVLFQEFISILDDEIHYTDVLQEGDRVQFISTLLKALVKDIQVQLTDIQELQTLCVKNKNLLADLQPWLNDKPSVDNLLVIRKDNRGLKSKLRHKLADLADLEEEISEENVGDLGILKKDVTSLRNDLQAAFEKEKVEMAKLTLLADKHFPELILQHPDLNLPTEIRYNGLVKEGWSLDHFDKTPVSDNSSTLLSSFCNKPIILKEHILDECLGVDSSEFLQSAVSYQSAACDFLLPVEAIFFVKKQRQAYVQHPHHECTLAQILPSITNLPSHSIYELTWGIIHGLHSLHCQGIVHGAIHPSNIYISSKGSCLIGEFDFSKSLGQRVLQCPTLNGLRFLCPEAMSIKGVLTPSVDMYSFGLLLLMMCFYQEEYPLNPDSSPDLSFLPQDDQRAHLIRNLLNPVANHRLTSADLVMSALFEKNPYADEAEDVLQLRPSKTPSPPVGGRPPGSILKNSSPTVSSPEVTTVEEEEVAAELAEEDQAEEMLAEIEAEENAEVNEEEVLAEVAADTEPEVSEAPQVADDDHNDLSIPPPLEYCADS